LAVICVNRWGSQHGARACCPARPRQCLARCAFVAATNAPIDDGGNGDTLLTLNSHKTRAPQERGRYSTVTLLVSLDPLE
jgi:hypothetical protein